MKKLENTMKNRTLVVLGSAAVFGIAVRLLMGGKKAADGSVPVGKLTATIIGGVIGIMASQGISSLVLKPKTTAK